MHSQNSTLYPNILYSRVYQWIQLYLISQATHIANNQLDQFAATQLLGPQDKAIFFITAYFLVIGQMEPKLHTVIDQRKRVLCTASDPQKDMLSYLHKVIVKIHQMDHLVVLGINANERCRQGGPT